MENNSEALLPRIFISSTDKKGHDVLYEHIVFKDKEAGLAGATVLKRMLVTAPVQSFIPINSGR